MSRQICLQLLFVLCSKATPMNYGKEIIEVLYEAGGEGLSVHKVAIHVHNAHNTLFSPIEFEEVRRDVQMWLLRNSRSSNSPVVHGGRRGVYRINMESWAARQMILEFCDKGQDETVDSQEDASSQQLFLFDI